MPPALPAFVRTSPSVLAALHSNQPVVALESTVIAHGLPYPQNLEAARRMEAAVREGGATPATVAVLGGVVKVGLTDDELAYLAQAKDVWKVSRRDLPVVVARKLDGATTVAGTMIVAHWAGIRVFATGGIGGVHRVVGGEWVVASGKTLTTNHYPLTTDISADLPELAQTPVVVVCAGAKAILDLPATLEWLETHSVPVIGYGTDEFPAFYSRSSGLKLEVRADRAGEVAEIAHAKWEMGLAGGVLVCVPVPEAYAQPLEAVEAAIQQALREAEERGVRGKAVTPFLLRRVAELTGDERGRPRVSPLLVSPLPLASPLLRANLALLENNARVAAEIAAALALK